MSARPDLIIPFAGPTFVSHWTIKAYMGSAISRHPNFKLIPLPRIGSGSVAGSVQYYAGLAGRVLVPELPYVAAGHSQGGIVAALHGLADPLARHVIMLDAPLHGAWLSDLLRMFPAGRELLAGSPLLAALREDILAQPQRFTSIFCPNEQVMEARSAYLPGITNILVGSASQLEAFERRFPDVVPSETVESAQPVSHVTAMRNPDFRGALWRIISREATLAELSFS